MNCICLAHGKAKEAIIRNMETWKPAFDQILIILPFDDDLDMTELRGCTRIPSVGASCVRGQGEGFMNRIRCGIEILINQGGGALMDYDCILPPIRIPDEAMQDGAILCNVVFHDDYYGKYQSGIYGHSPTIASADTWRRLLAQDAGIGAPDNEVSDRWMALCTKRAGIRFVGMRGGFSRDGEWDDETRNQAARSGKACFHGVKSDADFLAVAATSAFRNPDPEFFKPQMKIYIPISTNGSGSVKAAWAMSMITQLGGCDVHVALMGDSNADRACNHMCAEFLKSHCDVLLIIDCDIVFQAFHVERMIEHMKRGVQAVWGVYPKKDEKTDPCVCTFEDLRDADENSLVEVRRSGRGFLMVTREALGALKEENGGPALRYHNHGEVEWGFFQSIIAEGAMSAMSGRDAQGFPKREFLSEDWTFCERLRQVGIPTLVDMRIFLGHIGEKHFKFSDEQLGHVGHVHSNV